MSGSRSLLRGALRVGAIFLVAAVAGVLGVHALVDRWLPDAELRARVHLGTDIVFIVGTAALIVYLVHRELDRARTVETHYRGIVEQSLAGIYVLRGDRLVFANARLAEMLGYEPDELRESVSLSDLLAPEAREVVAGNVHRLLEGEVDVVHETLTGVRKDGEEIRVETHGRVVEWNGEPAIMGLIFDVTDRERLREEIRKAQRLDTLGELTGAVAHDFNNLLTAIIAPLELGEERLEPGDPVRQEITEAKDNAGRAITLTRQLLSFSRRRPYQPRPIDVNEFLRAREAMLGRLTHSAVHIRLDLADGLPAVEIDPPHWDQVLLNLVTNAAQAVDDEGEVRIRTESVAADEGGVPDVVLTVSDDGVGMDEETQERLFEPFFTTRRDGNGLGLSTVHGIVTQEGGTISVDSAPGEGTTFAIRLPGRDVEPEPLGTEEEEPEAEAAEELSLEGVRVLVVEDQAPVRRVTIRALRRYGLAVDAAVDAGEALEIATRGGDRIDLLLTDIGLPDVNGASLAEQIEEMIPNLPILFMSGYSDKKVLRKVETRDSVHFLEKPFSVDGLIGAVRSAVANARRGDGGPVSGG